MPVDAVILPYGFAPNIVAEGRTFCLNFKKRCFLIVSKNVCDRSRDEDKLVFVESDQPFVAQFAELVGHGASVDGQKVRKLLAVKGDGEGRASVPARFFGQIGHQLFAGRALCHVGELLHEFSVFFGYGKKQVLDHGGVAVAGGRARRQKFFCIEKKDFTVFDGKNVV